MPPANAKSPAPPTLPNPKTPRKRVLLAMGAYLSHERKIGIARYAREAGWILDSRLSASHARPRQRDYLASSRADGALTMLNPDEPTLIDIVKPLRVPI